jgi:hypothetical protein
MKNLFLLTLACALLLASTPESQAFGRLLAPRQVTSVTNNIAVNGGGGAAAIQQSIAARAGFRGRGGAGLVNNVAVGGVGGAFAGRGFAPGVGFARGAFVGNNVAVAGAGFGYNRGVFAGNGYGLGFSRAFLGSYGGVGLGYGQAGIGFGQGYGGYGAVGVGYGGTGYGYQMGQAATFEGASVLSAPAPVIATYQAQVQAPVTYLIQVQVPVLTYVPVLTACQAPLVSYGACR